MKANPFIAVVLLVLQFSFCQGQHIQQTYCNPLNLDYGYTPIPNFSEGGRHRDTADPVITLYKGDYYLLPSLPAYCKQL